MGHLLGNGLPAWGRRTAVEVGDHRLHCQTGEVGHLNVGYHRLLRQLRRRRRRRRVGGEEAPEEGRSHLEDEAVRPDEPTVGGRLEEDVRRNGGHRRAGQLAAEQGGVRRRRLSFPVPGGVREGRGEKGDGVLGQGPPRGDAQQRLHAQLQ